MNKERIGLIIALAVIVWLSATLVRVENERYAMSIGQCPNDPVLPVPDQACVRKAQTRPAWYWHLFYALMYR